MLLRFVALGRAKTRLAGGVTSRACLRNPRFSRAAIMRRCPTTRFRNSWANSVLGNFDDASFVYHDIHSRFFKKDNKFFVETDGPDGNLATFEVKYTFGIDPLQQYLVEFPDG